MADRKISFSRKNHVELALVRGKLIVILVTMEKFLVAIVQLQVKLLVKNVPGKSL